jgi:hypothetical protein
MSMDNKELVLAGNALVQWFNSQEIAPADAGAVMLKVLAKLIVERTGSNRNELDLAIDTVNLQLTHDINDRLFNVRKR